MDETPKRRGSSSSTFWNFLSPSYYMHHASSEPSNARKLSSSPPPIPSIAIESWDETERKLFKKKLSLPTETMPDPKKSIYSIFAPSSWSNIASKHQHRLSNPFSKAGMPRNRSHSTSDLTTLDTDLPSAGLKTPRRHSKAGVDSARRKDSGGTTTCDESFNEQLPQLTFRELKAILSKPKTVCFDFSPQSGGAEDYSKACYNAAASTEGCSTALILKTPDSNPKQTNGSPEIQMPPNAFFGTASKPPTNLEVPVEHIPINNVLSQTPLFSGKKNASKSTSDLDDFGHKPGAHSRHLFAPKGPMVRAGNRPRFQSHPVCMIPDSIQTAPILSGPHATILSSKFFSPFRRPSQTSTVSFHLAPHLYL